MYSLMIMKLKKIKREILKASFLIKITIQLMLHDMVVKPTLSKVKLEQARTVLDMKIRRYPYVHVHNR